MDSVLQDLRYALRSLRRSPGFALTVVIAMALGIGVNTMIFSVVNGVILRAWPFPHPERLVVVEQTNPRHENFRMGVSFPDLFDFRARARSFTGMGAYYESNAYLTLNREPERFEASVITSSLLPTLGVLPAMGRNFAPEEEVLGKNWSSVIISDRIWRDRFGADPRVLGRTLRMNGRTRAIVGIMPPTFRFPETADFWIPLPYDPQTDLRGEHDAQVVARLQPGVTLAAARAEMSGIAHDLEHQYPATNKDIGVAVTEIQESWTTDIKPMMTLLMAAVGFVLLIACANVANLMLARSSTRQRELSLRLALGAGRMRIMRQLLTESVVLAVMGGALGVLLAEWGNDLVLASIPIELPYFLHIDVDASVLLYTVLISMFAGILFGLVPAFQQSDRQLVDALKEGGAHASAGRARGRMRSVLVVAEVALAMVLLAGAGLMVRSFLRMQNLSSGVTPDGILTGGITLPYAVYPKDEQKREFFRQLLDQVAALPGVEAVSAINPLPAGNGSWTMPVALEGQDNASSATWPLAYHAVMTPGTLGTLGIPLRAGRDFTPDDRADTPPVVLVSETAAHMLWPNQDPLGRRLRFPEVRDSVAWRTVVGVVGDIRQRLRENKRPPAAVYVPHAQSPVQTMTLLVRSRADMGRLTASVRRLVQAKDPDLPFYEVRTMPESMHRSLWEPRLYAVLMGVFALLAVAIAAVGIYGVMAYSVAQRTQEIGIRMALGAAQGSVMRMVIGQAMTLTTIGLGIGLAFAFVVTRLMASLLFGVSTTDPPTYLGVTVILAGCALIASWLPALRATRVDPIVALRCE